MTPRIHGIGYDGIRNSITYRHIFGRSFLLLPSIYPCLPSYPSERRVKDLNAFLWAIMQTVCREFCLYAYSSNKCGIPAKFCAARPRRGLSRVRHSISISDLGGPSLARQANPTDSFSTMYDISGESRGAGLQMNPARLQRTFTTWRFRRRRTRSRFRLPLRAASLIVYLCERNAIPLPLSQMERAGVPPLS